MQEFNRSDTMHHDRESVFISDIVRAFNRIAEQKQQVNRAYRPQTNGTSQLVIQALTLVIKMYVLDGSLKKVRLV